MKQKNKSKIKKISIKKPKRRKSKIEMSGRLTKNKKSPELKIFKKDVKEENFVLRTIKDSYDSTNKQSSDSFKINIKK